MRAALVGLLGVVLLALALPAVAGPGAEEKLGEPFKGAAPGEKLVLLAQAHVDGVVTYQDATAAAERVVRAALCVRDTAPSALATADGPEARLAALGELRAAAKAKHKALNDERKGAGKKPIPEAQIEPDPFTQEVLAIEHVVAAAGPEPTVDKLACLELVRKNTSTMVGNRFCTLIVEHALRRDEAFLSGDEAAQTAIVNKIPDQVLAYSLRPALIAANKRNAALDAQDGYKAASLEGKLAKIKATADKDLGNNREAVVTSILLSWIETGLAKGEKPEELAKQLERWKKEKVVASPWAEQIVKRVGELRGKKK